ncbi:hypothetical protein V6N12_068504 [Hibiscus sabdariffa]|uniref:Uncharacterized protein n=1 Tax=Hibiscus sabdariffa TaxID=183260 RepID=A0ABR2FQB7_9ROSI
MDRNHNFFEPPDPSGRLSDQLIPTAFDEVSLVRRAANCHDGDRIASQMDMDAVTEINDEYEFGSGNFKHGQAAATVVSAMVMPVVASPSLPSFHDMVARRSPAGQLKNMIIEFDVDLTDGDMVVSNSDGCGNYFYWGSRFDVLADITEPQLNERQSLHTGQGNDGISLLPRVLNGQRHTVSLRMLDSDHVSTHCFGDSTCDVETSIVGDGGRVEAEMELRNVTMQSLDRGAQPSDVCAVEDAMINGLATTTVVEDNVVISSVAAKRKVVEAPSSLPSGKHIAERVVDESSKKILQEHNGKALYGPIRSATAKRVKRNSNISKPVARKDPKLKRQAESSPKSTVVADWAANLSSSLTKDGLAVDLRGPVDVSVK